MQPVILIPSLFTLLNGFFGFFAIVKIIEKDWITGAWLIIIAVLCDGMDGKLARFTDSQSRFGLELDSLADMISFGVAPALLIYLHVLKPWHFWGVLIAFVYLFSGAFRLARFNIDSHNKTSGGYKGLPIPVAGMTISALLLFLNQVEIHFSPIAWMFFSLILSGLMISTIGYEWPSLSFKGWGRSLFSVWILICLANMILFPGYALLPCMLMYILAGIFTAVYPQIMVWIEEIDAIRTHQGR